MPKKGLTQEIKSEIIRKVKEGKKVLDLAKEYGLSDKTIYRWIGGGAQGNEALEMSKLKRQNAELLRLVGQLTYEQELKKKGFNF
jgi:transposase-like protein